MTSQIDEIPEAMIDRLPTTYHRVLLARYATFSGGELQLATMNLVLSFRKNYDMLFPPLNAPTIVLQYIRELALPCPLKPLDYLGILSSDTNRLHSGNLCLR
jgi:hypothetical protein